MDRFGYPALRERLADARPSAAQKYDRAETDEENTLGDTLATIITFSGKPDRVHLSARAFPAIVELSDREGRDARLYLVQVGAPVDLDLGAERVRARNAVGASNAILSVAGFWAERGPRARGERDHG